MGARDELFSRLAADLAADIAYEMDAQGLGPGEVVDRVIPEGSPGSRFHRPLLERMLDDLLELEEPLDLVTCLQITEAMGWLIGLIETTEENTG